MTEHNPEKLLLLVDVQNVYYTTRQAFGRNFDYNTFWAQVTADRQVYKAIAYATDRGDTKQREFQNILRAIGFEVKLKPYLQRKYGSAKADWDVGITIDALEFADQVHRVVLVSGDGDYDLLVKKLREKYQITVDVYGVQTLTSDALIKAASHFYPIQGGLLL